MSTTINNKNRVSTLTGVAYAAPVVPLLVLMSSSVVLSGIYATYHGLSLTAISLVMLLVGLFDAVTDPSIGYFSDRYHARTGSRRPLVVVGAILLIPSAWFLLNPGAGVTAGYFLFWYLLFYLAVTLFQIPHLTWGGEISPVSEEKTKMYGFRNYAGYAGMILFVLIPILSFTETTQVTPETLRNSVIVAAVLFIPTLYLMLRHVPTGVLKVDSGEKGENPLQAIRTLAENKPFLWLLVASTLYTMGTSFFNGLYFMMVDAYLGLGNYYVYLLLFQLVVASLSIKPVMDLIGRIGKIKAWMMGILLSVISYMVLFFVLLDNSFSLYFLILFNAVFAFYSAISNVVVYSLLSDVSDFGTLKSGVDRAATYFSFQSLASKTSLAVGVALTIGLAGLLGFDPSSEIQGEETYWTLSLCMGVIPIVLSLIALVFIPGIAINAHRHLIIRKRLDARVNRANRAAIANDKSVLNPVC